MWLTVGGGSAEMYRRACSPWPGPVAQAPRHLRWNTGCFFLKAIHFPPSYRVSPERSLPWEKFLVISLLSQASSLLSLSTLFPARSTSVAAPQSLQQKSLLCLNWNWEKRRATEEGMRGDDVAWR